MNISKYSIPVHQIALLLLPLFPACFLNKCKTDGKRKPVHRVSPVWPHSIWSFVYCIPIIFSPVSSMLVMERWNTNCLYKAGEAFVAVYQVSDVVFNFIKYWDCWVHAATSNSSLPFKYSQNNLFWQTSSNKEISDLLQGSPWAVREHLCDTPCFLGITQGKGMAATLVRKKPGRCLLCWTTVVLKDILPSLPSSWQTSDSALQHDLSPLPDSHMELLELWLTWLSGGWDTPCACLVGGTWILSNLKELSNISALWTGEVDVQACSLLPVVRAAWGNQPCWCCGRATAVTGLSWSCSYNLPVLSWKY